MIPRRLVEEIESWQANRKFGSLQLNFQDGKIVNVNRVESIKVSTLGSVGEVTAQAITSTNV